MLFFTEFFSEFFQFLEQSVFPLWKTLYIISPIWLPPLLIFILFQLWVKYKRAEYLRKTKHILLEIKVPREITKSPLAMELFLNALRQTTGESTWYDRYVLGKVRAHFSLEIASIEGQVSFYIYTREFLRKFIETQLYSQYPDAEVHEVSDYTHTVPFGRTGSDWDLFGVEFELSKPDPYPIKTYIDYGLDKNLKEEEKIDPITPLIEYLGDMGRGEQAWFQIIIRANKGVTDPVSYWSRKHPWQEDGKKIVEEIMARAKERSGPPPTEEQGRDFRYSILTEGEQEVIKSIERAITKPAFDCGMRILYLARKDAFNPANVAGLFGVVKQYWSNDLNGFSPRMHTDVDYPWQKYINIPIESPSRHIPFLSLSGDRTVFAKFAVFNAFRRRSWFFAPYPRKPFVLNSEELATIYHFPGRVSGTPTFERVESKKSEPPANLPS